MKYAWIDTLREDFPLPVMCTTLAVSISGYRAWKGGGTPDRTRLTDGQLLMLLRSVHAQYKAAYGSPRMYRELRERDPLFLARVEDILKVKTRSPYHLSVLDFAKVEAVIRSKLGRTAA